MKPGGGRSALALFGGFMTVVVASTAIDGVLHASGVFPPFGKPMSDGLFALATAYRMALGAAGSYLAARWAGARPMWHAMVLGAIGTVAATAGLAATWNMGPEFGPRWYPIGLVLTALPCAWLGGHLYMRGKPQWS